MAIERRPRLDDGTFGPVEKLGSGVTDKERVEILEALNAELTYNSMMKEAEIENLKTTQAEITYQLMIKGVL